MARVKNNIPSPLEMWEIRTQYIEREIRKLESELEKAKKDLVESIEMVNKLSMTRNTQKQHERSV